MNTRVMLTGLLLALLLAGCTKQLITEQDLNQLKADKTSLETKNAELQKQTDDLKSQVFMIEPKAKLWEQTLKAYNAKPYDPPMPDHAWLDLGDGSYAFMNFDKAADANDKKLVYVGIALPGVFCKEDQEQLPPSFGHFHQAKCTETDPEKCDGGRGGEEGYWLMHVAVDEMDMPWGHVKPGPDQNFKLTDAPVCTPPEENASE